MDGSKKTYDLICSLGGNCTVGNALRFRNLRKFSLPFDWCYIVDEKPIYKLAECFKNNTLSEIAKKENLTPLTENEEKGVSHSGTIHYKDKYSGFYFVNHFYDTVENGGYIPFREKFDRRIKRLIDYIESSNSILFILGVGFEFNINAVYELKNILKNKYPNKKIDFEIIEFNCNEDKITIEEDLTVRKYKRDLNNYDFTKTNFEWAFLDEIKTSKLFKAKIPLWKKLLIKLCPIKEFRMHLKKIYQL